MSGLHFTLHQKGVFKLRQQEESQRKMAYIKTDKQCFQIHNASTNLMKVQLQNVVMKKQPIIMSHELIKKITLPMEHI